MSLSTKAPGAETQPPTHCPECAGELEPPDKLDGPNYRYCKSCRTTWSNQRCPPKPVGESPYYRLAYPDPAGGTSREWEVVKDSLAETEMLQEIAELPDEQYREAWSALPVPGPQAELSKLRAAHTRKLKKAAAARPTASEAPAKVLHFADSAMELPIAELRPSADNPRRNVGDVTELAASIRAVGIQQPLVVRWVEPQRYEVVMGHRRLAGAIEAGLEFVPCIVREFSRAEKVEAMAIENLQRVDLDPIEEAQAFKQLIALGYSQHKLAERIGRSQAHISRRLALLDLPAEAVDALDTGSITIEDAVALTKLKAEPERLKAVLNRESYLSLGRAVQNELDAIDREKVRRKVFDELHAQGTRTVDLGDKTGLYQRPEKRLRPPGQHYYSNEEFPIDLKKHEAEPCHAVAVDRSGGTFEVCTDPGRHTAKGKSDLKSKRATDTNTQAAKEKELERRRSEAAKRRRDYLGALVTSAHPAVQLAYVQSRAVPSMLDAVWAEVCKVACQLLGLPAGTGQASQELLEAEAKKRPLEVLLAVAIAQTEARDCGPWPTRKDRRNDYYVWLESTGYQLGPVELEELGRKS